jgi:hypothetical protein
MSQALYPEAKYPRRHLQIAVALSNLASLLQNQDTHRLAGRFLERVVEMDLALLSQGYAELAKCLLGFRERFIHRRTPRFASPNFQCHSSVFVVSKYGRRWGLKIFPVWTPVKVPLVLD